MMNDLVLSEDGHAVQADDYHDDEDWYQNRPGDEISSPKGVGFRPRRGSKAKYLIILGVVLIVGGFAIAMSGGKSEDAAGSMPANGSGGSSGGGSNSGGSNSGGSNSGTNPPTSLEDGVFDYLTQFVDKKILLDDKSYTFSAYNWLMKNSDIQIYGDSRIRQRFALASIYYATNEGLNSWVRDDGWISDQDECSWTGVRCDNGNIVGLNLTSNGLKGVFPMEVTMLKKHLLALELDDNELINEDQELRWIGQMSKLRLLDFEDTGFTAEGIPSYIGRLTDLRILEMANSNIVGDFDGSIFKNLKQLVYLDIGGILFNNTLPDEITQIPRLEALYAYDCGFEGELESFLPKFKEIQEIWLDDNKFSGQFPKALSHVSTLASLSLSNNALSGSLPTELGLLTNMEQLWLFGNVFSGDIPSEIGAMTSLQILGLEDNNMQNVTMPNEICDLGLVALGADCKSAVACSSDCCTCCEPPCPIAKLRTPDRRALLGF
ncbi:unnamed protein product [Cylindrotheca closterium]|uniref:Leucine-rich repeat-containing N-terminal plant-type domain-containing protein n=1 Tax=Cylindrotheca closterium TaxID=2856 RepID=A0AAD2JIB2_9STRA|nr:unnamed protein product [Cylindrotheca closterium]